MNGKWKLAELLGIGGTAAVYAATHRNGARVAIKIMHAEFTSDSERCARFQREGYAANLVEHPGGSRSDDGVDDEHGGTVSVMEPCEARPCRCCSVALQEGCPSSARSSGR